MTGLRLARHDATFTEAAGSVRRAAHEVLQRALSLRFNPGAGGRDTGKGRVTLGAAYWLQPPAAPSGFWRAHPPTTAAQPRHNLLGVRAGSRSPPTGTMHRSAHQPRSQPAILVRFQEEDRRTAALTWATGPDEGSLAPAPSSVNPSSNRGSITRACDLTPRNGRLVLGQPAKRQIDHREWLSGSLLERRIAPGAAGAAALGTSRRAAARFRRGRRRAEGEQQCRNRPPDAGGCQLRRVE